MKRLLQAGILLFFLSPVFFGCGKDGITVNIESQQSAFRQFLQGRNLIFTSRDSIYKYTSWQGSGATVTVGDEISISYVGSVFSSSATLGMGGIFTTNRPDVAAYIGLDVPGLLLDENLRVTLGNGSLIRGLDRGLEGCRRGDTVYLYITSDLAYDNQRMGVVPAGTPVVFQIAVRNQ